MKTLLFVFLAVTAFGDTMSNWALINGDGTVIAVLVANQDVGSQMPTFTSSVYPTAIKCVPALGAGMGWHYDSTTNTFTAPLPEVTTNVAQAPALFTLQDPTPVTFTTNNTVATPAVTTNNISILTTNNSQ
jgi:hypothetical protein